MVTEKTREVAHYHLCEDEECWKFEDELKDSASKIYSGPIDDAILMWRHWKLARSVGDTIPPWVVTYLDRCAEVVGHLEESAKEKTPTRGMNLQGVLPEPVEDPITVETGKYLLGGFGFSITPGPSSFTRNARERNELLIASAVCGFLLKGGEKADAYFQTAISFGIDERSAERIYMKPEFAFFREEVDKTLKTKDISSDSK
jgi:hypothetical protein